MSTEKSKIQEKIRRLLNGESGINTVFYNAGAFYIPKKGVLTQVSNETARSLIENPEVEVMTFRTSESKFSWDEGKFIDVGPEPEPLPEGLQDRKKTVNFTCADKKTGETLLKLLGN